MDAKTAVEYLKKHDTIKSANDGREYYQCVSHEQALEIADLIEQLEGVATIGKHLEKHLLTNVNPASQEIAKGFREALERLEAGQ